MGTGSSFSVRYVAKETEDPKLSSLKIGEGEWFLPSCFCFNLLCQKVIQEGLNDTDSFLWAKKISTMISWYREEKRLEGIFRYYSSIATVRLLEALVAKETVVDSFVYNYWFPLVVCW